MKYAASDPPAPSDVAARTRRPDTRREHARRWCSVLVLYALLLASSLSRVGQSSAAYWTAGALAAGLAAFVALRSGFSASFYGITRQGMGRALGSGVLTTAGLVVMGAALLVWLQARGHVPEGQPLFALQSQPELLVYVLVSAPVQELVFRGVFQSSARFLLGERPSARALAMGCSTFAYCASHLPWGLAAAAVMVVPGLIWALQFERDRSLVGVIFSHMAIGYLAVGATPLWRLLQGQ